MKTGIPTKEEKELLGHLSLFKRRGLIVPSAENLDSFLELEKRGYAYESHGTVGTITAMRKNDVSLYGLTNEGNRVYGELRRNNWPYLLLQNVQRRFRRA